MRKITCINTACRTNFNFYDEKNPNAKMVKCPKCGNVQSLDAVAPQAVFDDADWMKPPDAKVKHIPPIEREKGRDDDWLIVPDHLIKTPSPPPPVQVDKGNERDDDWSRKPKEMPKPKQVDDRIGWLIIHDEFTPTYTFDLRKGVNRIGRESETTDQDVSVRIATQDQYMSRHHCDIEARWHSVKNVYEYVLSDKEYQRKPHSKNGTFVNGSSRLTRRDEVLLDDGDTVQVGRTKLVLKLPSSHRQKQDAESSVREMDFFKTIIQ